MEVGLAGTNVEIVVTKDSDHEVVGDANKWCQMLLIRLSIIFNLKDRSHVRNVK
jgi:hypothetical protein